MSDGYDADFLGATLPLPRPDRETRELPYPRFTVLLDTQRRFAAVTAVNIDGARLREVPRTGNWRLDDRVERHEQAGNDIYRNNDLDRGHLVRRRDPGWGEPDDARDATRATFFYPNAAPQASGFNQSKQLWLGLEDHVLAYAEASDQRVSVFTAPVLADDDPPYRTIQVPLRFWKVAAWRGPDGLAATGFILDQTELIRIDEGLRTVAPLGAFRTFQVRVSQIAELAGVDFGTLPEVDVMDARAVRTPAWRELSEPQDIIV